MFSVHRELPMAGASHADHLRSHLRGMWVAFGIAAGFIVYFLMRIRHALDARETELEVERQKAVRAERRWIVTGA